ncbi:hypothetical protein E2C01_044243 [Portunus trituberculatus]|uniref:Uncharacterized protein n=1 Tax=Portunus trituberculatus TaxID=210409 RepID=A0A5B7FYJ1_PORTR|nr:hypothetical protein [Portunus trituberculatus]
MHLPDTQTAGGGNTCNNYVWWVRKALEELKYEAMDGVKVKAATRAYNARRRRTKDSFPKSQSRSSRYESSQGHTLSLRCASPTTERSSETASE